MDMKFGKKSIQDMFNEHFKKNIQDKIQCNQNDNREKIAILCTGCYCPPHLGHYSMMEYAINEVQNQKKNFVIGIFSPAWDTYMQRKVQDVPLKLNERKAQLEGLIYENNKQKYNMIVDDFEGTYHRFIDYPELNSLYKQCFNQLNIKLAYCIGSDLLKYGIDRAFTNFADYLIVIERDQLQVNQACKKQSNILVVQNTPTKDLNSTLIRKQIVAQTHQY